MTRNAFEIDPSHFPELWKTALQGLQQRLTPEKMRAWIISLNFVGVRPSDAGWLVSLSAPTEWHRNWVAEHHLGVLEETFSQILGGVAKIALTADEGPRTDAPAPYSSPQETTPPARTSEPMERAPDRGGDRSGDRGADRINPQFTFASFVVGGSNQFAHASALAVARKPAQEYNPLFLYGSPGLGKTHLLHAIANEVRAHNPNARIAYLSAEQFVNELIEAIKTQEMNRFRNRYRNNCDLILIDDIQFLAGKGHSEEEFFHTFNALHGSGRQIVVTSDRPPKEIADLEERVKTRFLSGLVADIQAPGMETRIAILKHKSERDDVYLPDDVATFIASHIKSNVRELHGALIKLEAQASLTGAEISLDMARKQLNIEDGDGTPTLSIETIQAAVARHYNVKVQDLKGPSRARQVARPRQVAMYLARKYTDLSLKEIGAHFGGRDHTTALHACETIESSIETDSSIREAIESIQNLL